MESKETVNHRGWEVQDEEVLIMGELKSFLGGVPPERRLVLLWLGDSSVIYDLLYSCVNCLTSVILLACTKLDRLFGL